MPHPFDPGPVDEPFASLARDYPGAEAYPPELFRVEWGPIFHRGRLDGSARVLVIAQDPGQHESIARRCLVGEAGHRVQGFLRKLGITCSYTIVNAYLYSVVVQPTQAQIDQVEAQIAPYRNRWLEALLLDSAIEAVVTFGTIARMAFEAWRGPESSPRTRVAYQHVFHPTYPRTPEDSKRMLAQWNAALPPLRAALSETDADPDLEPYGDDITAGEKPDIPEADLPAGAPPWMRSAETWAWRQALLPNGAGSHPSDVEIAEAKRATVVVSIPTDERPWKPLQP
jgi:hypothetical protein